MECLLPYICMLTVHTSCNINGQIRENVRWIKEVLD